MSSLDDEFAELEDRIIESAPNPAVAAAEELWKRVSAAAKAGGDFDGEWSTKVVLYRAATAADAARDDRQRNVFNTALRLHVRHYEFLKDTAEIDVRVRAWLTSLLNDVAWAHLEHGDARKAKRVNREVTGILERMVGDQNVMTFGGWSQKRRIRKKYGV